MEIRASSFLVFFAIFCAFSYGHANADENEEHECLSFYVIPEVDDEGDTIVRLRILLENTSDKPLWIRDEDLKAKRVGFTVKAYKSGLRATGGETFDMVLSHAKVEEKTFTKIPARKILSKLVELPKDRYISLVQYLSGEFSCSFYVKMKKNGNDEEPKEYTEIEGKLVKTSFFIKAQKKHEIKEENDKSSSSLPIGLSGDNETLSSYVIPETNADGKTITKLRVLIENTSKESVWLNLRKMSIKSSEKKNIEKDLFGIRNEKEYVEILPQMAYGEIVELPKDEVVMLEEYMQDKIFILCSIRVKKNEGDKNVENVIELKTHFVKADFSLEVEKKNVVDFERFRYFSASVIPETNVDGNTIVKLRVFFENTSNEAIWIQCEKMTVVVYVSENEKRAYPTSDPKPPVAYGEYIEPPYTEVLPENIIGKVMVLPEKKYIDWQAYAEGRIEIIPLIKFKKKKNSSVSAFSMAIKAQLIKPIFLPKTEENPDVKGEN